MKTNERGKHFRFCSHLIIMGDCRIRIVISKELITSTEQDVSISRVYSSDTTIREVVEEAELLLQLYTSNASFHLWDTTLSPPKDITAWPMKEFPELQGQKSKTLHSAGCFPSGSWLALPKNMKPHQFKATEYDDTQYNNQQAPVNEKGTNKPAIQFNDKELAFSKPLPSQVMQSVAKRFDNDQATNTGKANDLRRENQESRQKLERERAAKLDQRIQKLEEKSNEKNKKVSEQVRRMLIKSRSTGAKSLKVQDRLYFECMVDGESELAREYRYFSPQDTFAKIASSFARPKQSELKSNAVLVKRDAVYQRFPVAMRVYEAIAEGYLTGQLDIIVIRWYRDDEAPAHSVKLDEKETPMEDVEMEDVAIHPNEMEETMAQDLEIAPSETNLRDDKSLGELIQKLDTKLNKGKKPKKKSTAALKVRNMQIKSKAKGDAKRIPKVEDRFFLEVVMISKSNTAEGSFCFLAKKDPMERILQVVAASTTSATDWEFLVPTEDPFKFNIITDPLTSLKDAEERQILKCFDRIILCPRP
jgi:hypothetical protein